MQINIRIADAFGQAVQTRYNMGSVQAGRAILKPQNICTGFLQFDIGCKDVSGYLRRSGNGQGSQIDY